MKVILTFQRNRIVVGPMAYSMAMFAHGLQKLNVSYRLPVVYDKYIRITNDIEMFPCSEIKPHHDPLLQELSGPIMTYTSDNMATAMYTVVDRTVAHIRHDLMMFASDIQYKKETAGLKMQLQGTEVSINTDQSSRLHFVCEAMAGNVWKFGATSFLVLSQSDVDGVKNAMITLVSESVKWESDIVKRIMATDDPRELKNIQSSIIEVRNAIK